MGKRRTKATHWGRFLPEMMMEMVDDWAYYIGNHPYIDQRYICLERKLMYLEVTILGC